jgi:hypothetical protein
VFLLVLALQHRHLHQEDKDMFLHAKDLLVHKGRNLHRMFLQVTNQIGKVTIGKKILLTSHGPQVQSQVLKEHHDLLHLKTNLLLQHLNLLVL